MARRIAGLVLFIGLPILLAVLAYTRLNRYQPYGTPLLNPRPAAEFTLASADNPSYKLSDLKGKAVFIFFGFVNCPDVCPTTMQDLKRVYAKLTPEERARVQVLLISVDPERDTPESLGKYVRFFDPSFVGLSGTPEATAQVAKDYGVFYQKSQIKSAQEYNVDHTASVFLIDPKGQLRLIYGQSKIQQDPDKVVQDVRWLLKGS
ncbi:SCO family protein [Calidithermus chliarophilus]|uniref:SCO family protein n=1 Tax=Calidithermus chliarophilus TaxID=52023 RepID=UPI000480567E|nr:SCO family protein [Calidithermus chliarophilus]